MHLTMSTTTPTAETVEAQRLEPSRGRGWALLGLIVSITYLLNFQFGVLELPDYLPIVGNLDEVLFSGLLFASLAKLGINVLPWVQAADAAGRKPLRPGRPGTPRTKP